MLVFGNAPKTIFPTSSAHPRYPRKSRLRPRARDGDLIFRFYRCSSQIIWELRLSFPVKASERPERSFHDEKSRTAKTRKRKNQKMKKLNITFGTILVALGCFALPSAVQAAGHHFDCCMCRRSRTVIPPAVRRPSLLINGMVMGSESKQRIWLRALCVRAHSNRRPTGAIITTMSPGRSILPARQAATGTKTWSSLLVPMARVTRGLSLKTSMMRQRKLPLRK